MRCSTAMLAGLLWTACGRHEEEPPPPPSTPHEGLNVLETGKGPLRPLRYHLTKGTRTPIELTLDAQIHTEGQGKNPVLVLDMDVLVEDVQPDGTARVRTTVTKGSARGDADTKPDLMASQAALLEGIAVVLTVAPDGRVTSTKIDARADLPKPLADSVSKLEQAVGNLSLPLPSVPVGVGATWKSRKTIEQNGIKLIADTTYELTGLAGDKLTLARKATFSGAVQSIDVQGTKVDIKSASGSLDGKATVDLARMVMTDQATSHLKFEMVVTMPPDAGEPGGPATVEVDLATTATPDVTPGAAPPSPPGDAGVDARPADAGPSDASPPPDAAKPAPKKHKPKPKPKPKPDAGTDEPTPDTATPDTPAP